MDTAKNILKMTMFTKEITWTINFMVVVCIAGTVEHPIQANLKMAKEMVTVYGFLVLKIMTATKDSI